MIANDGNLTALPKGWVCMPLKEIVLSVKGKKPKALGPKSETLSVPYVNIKAFEKKMFTKFTDGNGCELCGKKDTLIVWDGARCGLVGRGVSGAVGSTLAKLIHFGINSTYLFFFLHSKFEYINKRPRGVGIPHVEPNLFWNMAFPLPPFAEQRRIVAKIEELFTKLDAGVEALKKVRRELKRYRQAVLKYVFEGKLTAEWRQKNKDKLQPASKLLERIAKERRKNTKGKKRKLLPLDTSKLPELPEGWEWVKLNDIAHKITDGTHFTPTYVNQGLAFISVKDIRGGRISFGNCKYISEDEHNTLIKRCNPQYGDVLITKSGTIGRVAVNKTDRPFSLFVSVALIKPVTKYLSSDFIAHALKNYINGINIQQAVKGGVIKNLHIEDLRLIPIALPSCAEQQKIAEEIERHFSVADQIEQTIEQCLKQSDRLRQSILKKAFEGKLVPQDPEDEPAEKLLERIKNRKNETTGGSGKLKREQAYPN